MTAVTPGGENYPFNAADSSMQAEQMPLHGRADGGSRDVRVEGTSRDFGADCTSRNDRVDGGSWNDRADGGSWNDPTSERQFSPTSLKLSPLSTRRARMWGDCIDEGDEKQMTFSTSDESIASSKFPRCPSEHSKNKKIPSATAENPPADAIGAVNTCTSISIDEKESPKVNAANKNNEKHGKKEVKKKAGKSHRKSTIKAKPNSENSKERKLVTKKGKESLKAKVQKASSVKSNSTMDSEASQVDTSPGPTRKTSDLLEVPNKERTSVDTQLVKRNNQFRSNTWMEFARNLRTGTIKKRKSGANEITAVNKIKDEKENSSTK